ncbi:MAG: hypothetical protein QOE72_4342, partial [Chloroflexota bacterium]|nr:hypothetical protein [Chloroflexota bacterium]
MVVVVLRRVVVREDEVRGATPAVDR